MRTSDLGSALLMNPGVFSGSLDHRLEGREWIVDDYSIADIATFGWVNALVEFYAAGDILGLKQLFERAGMARTRAGATGCTAWPRIPANLRPLSPHIIAAEGKTSP